MDLLTHEVTTGDSLYGIARQHNVDIRDLQVVRGDQTFDLGATGNGFDPTSLGPGDKVLTPNAAQPCTFGVNGCGADVEAQAAAANADTQTLTTQGEAVEKDCAAADGDLSTESPCEKPRYVVVIDPGHGGTSYTDNYDDSSWNNAIGVVSNVLEKTMSHRFAAIVKQTLDNWAGKFAAYVDIEVLLTKTDENLNLRGRDRAKVAKDAKADFFVILHFNSVGEGSPSVFTRNGLTKRVTWEEPGYLDLTPGVVGQTRDQPEGFKRRLFSTTSPIRGAQRVKRSSNINEDLELVTSDAFAKAVVGNVVTMMKQLDSTPSIKVQGDAVVNTAALSRIHLGTKGIATCYLEGDYINIESGDRLWNPVQYAANIASVNGGTAADASTLPAANAMYESGSVAIALAILMPILRTDVVARSGKDLDTLVGMLGPQAGIQPVLESQP
ncbi:N-acetylmuramoyl-L-alanine amidase [Chondromyces apiculatus]|uniref:N-acetylmuramoyl-L-alanine amidase n=1 Tax=Chondromyces apiculatus DSM 436 TaxID=1192034 RepID=A0A017T150_9BACT|nr:N-acetylmuramoyl-L-alanine amidase [Chondromyces apiculatus]EYF02727.1 Hypothetical protein CAP_6617 [Chondromyces apiculatus DSM 436]